MEKIMPTQLDTKPYWTDSASMPRFPRLDQDVRCDVLVVGGGIAGLTSAYLLAREGRSVVLVERRRCGDVDTGHTTAHLTMVTDRRMTDLERSFGRDHARAAWDAGLAAIGQIHSNVRDEQIDCDFEWTSGYLHAVPGEKDPDIKSLRKEADLVSSLGFDAHFLEDVPFMHTPGVCYEDQARFHPRKYLAGLARTAAKLGVRIHEHTDAQELPDPRSCRANGHTISFDHIVIATHSPMVGSAGFSSATLLQTKLALYTSYVVAARVAKGIVPDALFWDTSDPYTYTRLEPGRGHDLVIFGGEDHKTGQVDDTTACFDRLEKRLAEVVPGAIVTNRWSGQVIETVDGLPYIGQTSEHEFTATGFSGNGMTFGTLSGMMACDYVMGRRNPWSELFEISRKKVLAGAWDYVKENKDYPYYLLRDRLTRAEARSLRDVRRGQGRVLEFNGEQVAAYRNPSGELSVCSAICTHMGCLVDWNDAERTWDCPCHGSRFDTAGGVISGPAGSPLGKVETGTSASDPSEHGDSDRHKAGVKEPPATASRKIGRTRRKA